MIIDDFVMLGKTVPETNADGREFVCTAGYSRELRSPIRIYPMAHRGCPPRWSVSRIPVERNPKDSRPESWKIRGDRSPAHHTNINQVIDTAKGTIDDLTKMAIVEAMTVRSIVQANEERRSLCVLLPSTPPKLHFDKGEKVEMAPTPNLFGHVPQLPVMQRFPWHPRLEFDDQDGKHHDLMLRDWGCYELMRKTGVDYTIHMLEKALRMDSAPPLFCGNFNNHRISWLIISVFSAAIFARDVPGFQSSFDFPVPLACL